jgi:hypothetical protein
MSTSSAEIACGSMRRSCSARHSGFRWPEGSTWQGGWQGGCRWQGGPTWRVGSTGTWREASLNWLALGLLLAAWNAADNDTAAQPRRRPEALRGYSSVSVRAATLHFGEQRTSSAERTSPVD